MFASQPLQYTLYPSTTPTISTLLYFALLLSTTPSTTATDTDTQTANATCYWPNGQTDTNYVPCPNSKTCCLRGEACLSNGLCYGPKLNIAYRGACTDDSWPISECPRVCYTEIPDQWANLFSCPNSTTNVFTCGTAGWATDVCDQNVGTWQWDSGNVTIGQNGLTSLSTTTTTTTTTNSSSTTTNTTTGVSVSSGSNNLTTSSGIPTETTSSSSSSKISALALGAGLGAGLGVPLLILSAFMVYFCVRVRRRLRAAGLEGHENPRRVPYRQQGVVEIATQSHNMATELDGFRPCRAELYG
ncbi:uncharacterized protein BO80DRAFT_424838 [Aspergillus ibericus CBS 121593]|uniref:Mid2 domain-containing protein n=1 Tax=Aspergillus ibericus CBS 121593 TaxID=1448316 RepID=A0A395H0Z0_9EURO|nr:hypothetical protein BO80DRAFT_424838 [Aspergillus ibericus CBS 121593]RAL01273.1 hypothetical protein BO80DRAFT_424838 [Aspergillus ibericus CBS 121593]